MAGQLVSANQHPLKPIVENVSLTSQTTKETAIKNPLSSPANNVNLMIDPLNEAMLDPLSRLVADVSLKGKVNTALGKFFFN